MNSVTIFSNQLDDVFFVRKKRPLFTVRYAADSLLLKMIVEQTRSRIIFASRSVSSAHIKQFAESNGCNYTEYQSRDELSLLVAKHLSFHDSHIQIVNRPEEVNEYPLEAITTCKTMSKTFSALVGTSRAMQNLRAEIIRVAKSDVSVLLLGETGTGKSTVARAIHELSARRALSFKSAFISNTNESLVEAKLFGVNKGGFTDAVSAPGVFEEASGGTLFLDEVGEISPSVQTKLLQVLSDGVVNRIGSNKDILIDARMIFATNANLERKIREHTFREDLFYRMNDVSIVVPPLRDRLEDIPELARAYLKREQFGKTISDTAIQTLQTLSWNGNIRQLEKCLKRAALLYCDGDVIEPKHIHL